MTETTGPRLVAGYAVVSTYHFVKSADGRYLQAQFEAPNSWRFWLDRNRAWSPCCDTAERARAFVDAARQTIGVDLVVVKETV